MVTDKRAGLKALTHAHMILVSLMTDYGCDAVSPDNLMERLRMMEKEVAVAVGAFSPPVKRTW